ncbi:MAG TPA: TVP38/TMEM64 family protein [Alkalispirochaeta sp.]|nr:TVP38/TMEM64 family protein [Alkalispirochaeta sp.]
MNKPILIRIATFLVLLGVTVILVVAISQRIDGEISWSQVFSSRKSVREFVEQFDPYHVVVFIVLQAAQVVIAPIPANVVALAGGALFGVWGGFLVSSSGLIIGSLIAFGIARFFGRPVVEAFVAPATIDRYIDGVANRHFLILLVIVLMPFFPDDVICFVAGLSSMPVPAFLFLIAIGRTPGMLVSSLVGSGATVIPWWGWILIATISAAVLIGTIRYRSVLERKLGLRRSE